MSKKNHPIMFLDVDGVLNAMGPDDRGRITTAFRRECIDALNLILATECRIVLSSAWRYQILNGDMTANGFEIMLHSHGATPMMGRIIGNTCADEDCAGRGLQIDRWIRSNEGERRYVVIDDEDDQISMCDHPLIRTDSRVGLTEVNARAAIEILTKGL